MLSTERIKTELLQGLHDAGYDEGRNLVIEYRPMDRPEMLVRFAADLVYLDVDVIVASGLQAVKALIAVGFGVPAVICAIRLFCACCASWSVRSGCSKLKT